MAEKKGLEVVRSGDSIEKGKQMSTRASGGCKGTGFDKCQANQLKLPPTLKFTL